MAFNIVLYSNTSEKNAMTKTLTNITTLEGSLVNETSIIDPVLLVAGSMSDFKSANYIYIDSFNRYYFITDIKSIRSGIVQLTCHVDVLFTYRAQILKNYGIISRQQNQWNRLLNDGTFKTYSNPHIITRAFPNGFGDNKQYILAVAGH